MREPRQSSRDLASRLRGLIESGQWAVGSRMPSTRQIAQQYGVSRVTVQRALVELQTLGMIEIGLRRRPTVRHRQPQRPPPRSLTPGSQVVLLTAGGAARPDDPKDLPDSWVGRIHAGVAASLARREVDLQWLRQRRPQTAGEADALVGMLVDQSPVVCGVIIVQPVGLDLLQPRLEAAGLAWVVINRPLNNAYDNFITADFIDVSRLVGLSFGALGYRRVWLMGLDDLTWPSAVERASGFLHGYLASGGNPQGIEFIHCEAENEQATFEQVRERLMHHPPPDGIFAAGDPMAVGAMRALTHAGVRVPEQVGVVGSTGLELARHATPSLSTVHQPLHEIGEAAGDMIYRMLRTGQYRQPGRILPARYVLRGSVPDTPALRLALAPHSAARFESDGVVG